MSVSIVVDIGGTSIKLALVAAGKLLAEDVIEVADNRQLAPILPVIVERVNSLMSSLGIQHHDLGGVGAAFPCIIDSKQGRILSDFVKYTDANDLDLHGWVNETWQIPLVMENDARAALVGEWQYGHGQGVNHLVQMTFGTGIGTAVLMDGRLLRGSHFLAGNLGGHVTIDLHGDLCSCGNIGCVEAVASTWALPAMLDRMAGMESNMPDVQPPDYKTIFEWAAKGDKLALAVKEQSIYTWGLAMVNLVHAFDPERVIVSGGVMREGENILSTFQAMLDKHTWLPSRGNVKVVMAKNRTSAALLGMDYLVQNRN